MAEIRLTDDDLRQLARDEALDRSVALKVLPPDLVKNDARVRRFIQEAKSASRRGPTSMSSDNCSSSKARRPRLFERDCGEREGETGSARSGSRRHVETQGLTTASPHAVSGPSGS
jgi:hypothetical protein